MQKVLVLMLVINKIWAVAFYEAITLCSNSRKHILVRDTIGQKATPGNESY